ncbi:mechanosensitive ion channel [Cytophagaceae bacterium YF14B1]|uniref:Mechanosensitive ion channel n=2 Tax=Xanthocytophaga flava TaxID=3048013 RepID=A0AAE3UBP3_9BACT|nr:mechanosensitive ion channel [Xanthocytophaga flavus]
MRRLHSKSPYWSMTKILIQQFICIILDFVYQFVKKKDRSDSLVIVTFRSKQMGVIPDYTISANTFQQVRHRKRYPYFLLILVCLALQVFPERAEAVVAKPRENTKGPSITVDSLVSQIESMYTTLNRINFRNRRGFATREIDQYLPEVKSNIQIIRENLALYKQVINIKNLETMSVLLKDMKNDLEEWRKTLIQHSKDLKEMNQQLVELSRDFNLRIQQTSDTSVSHLYTTELKELKEKWVKSRKATSENIAKINHLQAVVSDNYFESIELQNEVRDMLRQSAAKTAGKEYDFLWETPGSVKQDDAIPQMARKSYEGQRKILKYYIDKNGSSRLGILALGGLFFWWVFSNFRKIDKLQATEALSDIKIQYLKPIPVISTLVVILILAPFIDLHPPSAYVDMMQFFLLITLTVFIWRNWPMNLFYYWLAIIIFYVLFLITNNFLAPTLGPRLLLLALNVASVVFGLLFFSRIRKALSIVRFVRVVSIIYIVFNVLSILLNLFGRLSLAKTYSMTAIFGITQIIGLAVFIQLLTEAIQLHLKKSQLSKGIASRFDQEKIQKVLNKGLLIIAIVFWVVIFTINLNMYSMVFGSLERLLTRPRSLGNTSFTLGNVLLFFAIIYISNLLQKNIGLFFGETDDETIPDKKGSRLVVMRLILLLLGFLLAIAASGLPIDKITIILGALGVGIGLGLQNIVNNLVSGVILIFERPFEIGDSIEVASKKGRVKDIGIRSSRLITAEGSEIIVPNGDLLSGHVVNWTLNNNHVRIEMIFKVGTGVDLETVKSYLQEEIMKNPNILSTTPPDILLSGISEKSFEIKVLFWISNIRKEQVIKSEILTSVYKRFVEQSVPII